MSDMLDWKSLGIYYTYARDLSLTRAYNYPEPKYPEIEITGMTWCSMIALQHPPSHIYVSVARFACYLPQTAQQDLYY